MNVDDLLAREAIRHTLNSYHIAGDGNDAEGYAAVFTEDGVVRAAGVEFKGRENLRAWKASRTKAMTAAFVRHNLTTCKIDLTGPDSAKGRAYFFVVTDAGPDHCGTSDDVYRFLFEERSTGPVSMCVTYTARYTGNGTDEIRFVGTSADGDNTDVDGTIRLEPVDAGHTRVTLRQMLAPDTPVPRLLQGLIKSFVQGEAATAVGTYLKNVAKTLGAASA